MTDIKLDEEEVEGENLILIGYPGKEINFTGILMTPLILVTCLIALCGEMLLIMEFIGYFISVINSEINLIIITYISCVGTYKQIFIGLMKCNY
jgi:hypothetical protein